VLRREAQLCPECFDVKIQMETLGPQALIECMTCDKRAVLRTKNNRPEFDCKVCRRRKIEAGDVPPVTRNCGVRRADAFEDYGGSDNSARNLEGEGRG
jgi:hypothetical protein